MKKSILLILITIFLSSCGGGGGSSTNQEIISPVVEMNTTESTVENSDTSETKTSDTTTQETTSLTSPSVDATNWLTYLNSLRSNSGMTTWSENEKLNLSSLNHSKYINDTEDYAHLESNSGNSFYTGDYASDRAVNPNVGYEHRSVGENISNSNSERDSIDILFSAIYHRMGFLSFLYDEVGLGVAGKYYTYNMGLSVFSDLCATNWSGVGTYYGTICGNGNLVGGDDYDTTLATQYGKNPDIVVFPYENADNFPPVFYEEFPDPLPNTSMSGNPISIHFNPSVSGSVSFVSLQNKKTSEIFSNFNGSSALLMTSLNDPNSVFTTNDFALFPYTRLDWGTEYEVNLDYAINGVIHNKRWSFITTVLENLHEITENTTNINVNSNEKFHLYFKLKNGLERLTQGFSYSYPSTVVAPVTTGIDSNTYSVLVRGNSGDKVTVTYSSGSTFTITIN